LDGVRYHSGRTYKVKRQVAAVLKDQMDRSWRQEAARLGEPVDNLVQRRMIVSARGATYAS
jgi:hypothetical protein